MHNISEICRPKNTALMEEPFLLPIGPNHGDSFNRKTPTSCSEPISVPFPIKIGSKSYTTLYVCNNGLITFGDPVISYQPADFDSMTTPVIAALFEDNLNGDNFLDQMCLQDGGAYYTETMYETERICWYYWNYEPTSAINYLGFSYDYIDDARLKAEIKTFAEKPLTRAELTLGFDDCITGTLMGEDKVKYINLANNVMKREMSTSDIEVVQQLINDKFPGQIVKWGFVATWYQISPYPGRLDAFNSYQNLLFCTESPPTSDPGSFDLCYVLFDFFEIQWLYTKWERVMAGRVGINDGEGSIVELPYAGSSQLKKLYLFSNIRDPGLWLYSISQGNTPNPASIVSQGNFDVNDVFGNIACEGPLLTLEDAAWAPHSSPVEFKIQRCTLPVHTFLGAQVVGQNNLETIETDDIRYNKDTFEIFMNITWYFREPVVVILVLDTVPINVPALMKMVFFYDPTEDRKKMLEFVQDNSIISVTDGKGDDLIDKPNCAQNGIKYNKPNERPDDPGSKGPPPAKDIAIPGEGQFQYNISLEVDGDTEIIRLHICFANFTLPMKIEKTEETNAEYTCSDWDEQERTKDYSECEEKLEEVRGCPRQPSGLSHPEREDAWWAEREVLTGANENRWKYDICCSQENTEESEQMKKMGFCDPKKCEFNSGATFCIQSPQEKCKEKNSQKTIYVSNQCCYRDVSYTVIEYKRKKVCGWIRRILRWFSFGLVNRCKWKTVVVRVEKRDRSLILSGEGSGYMSVQKNSLYNVVPYYYDQIRAYERCTTGSAPSNGLELFKRHRKTIIAEYKPRRSVFPRGDPSIPTLDGLQYPFMGIGVYTLLESSLEESTAIQASMRRLGNGTVFSGLALSYPNHSLECYIDSRGEFSYALNGYKMTLDGPKDYILHGFSVTRNTNNKHFTFELLENSLSLQVIITDNYLNFVITPPDEFRSNMDGLLGHFDGDSSNDFTAKDGTVVPVGSDPYVIHDQFGETWKVEESDWLFNLYAHSVQIKNDTENGVGFVPVLEPHFASDGKRIEAENACDNNKHCLLDVYLAGIGMADNYKALEETSRNVNFWNEVRIVMDSNGTLNFSQASLDVFNDPTSNFTSGTNTTLFDNSTSINLQTLPPGLEHIENGTIFNRTDTRFDMFPTLEPEGPAETTSATNSQPVSTTAPEATAGSPSGANIEFASTAAPEAPAGSTSGANIELASTTAPEAPAGSTSGANIELASTAAPEAPAGSTSGANIELASTAAPETPAGSTSGANIELASTAAPEAPAGSTSGANIELASTAAPEAPAGSTSGANIELASTAAPEAPAGSTSGANIELASTATPEAPSGTTYEKPSSENEDSSSSEDGKSSLEGWKIALVVMASLIGAVVAVGASIAIISMLVMKNAVTPGGMQQPQSRYYENHDNLNEPNSRENTNMTRSQIFDNSI
ncbi:uncharacterized protein LOC134851395 isoform X2 [Symsagittifera roscoffensis]|uniref:uncharacterized protein LOC134851395 isoform X2 n=1 Tax=Symsagittifera roscoffensis TaxID=84072 RepID=UPI00307CB320